MSAMSLDNLLQLDFREAWVFLGDVIRHPSNDPQAFALLLAAITVAVLLVVLIMLLVFMTTTNEERGRGVPGRGAGSSVDAGTGAAPSPQQQTASEHEGARRAKRASVGLVWLLVALAVWITGGWVTSRDSVCVSCHLDDSAHAVRMEGGEDDPHADVACVGCHESPSLLARVTVAVPRRAVHFMGGFALEKLARGYGVPVAVKSCSECHKREISETVEDDGRGVRMSHAEPLDAKAYCNDCHALHPDTGIVDRFTVGMAPCLRCHDANQAPAECSYCHTKDVAYAMQSRGEIRPVSHVRQIDCGGCHSQASCDACHGLRMPHTPEFMGGAHAREAVEDIWHNGGRTCDRCHFEMHRPCTKCHVASFPGHAKETWPRDHAKADPRNNGCDSCHGKLAVMDRNFCLVCHDPREIGMSRQ